jgi:hypothetical protein
VTAEYDVPLMVTRGYPSLSFLHAAADAIANQGKPTHLYYFGDYDPSGVDITRAVEEGIREFAPEAEIYFERVAVTPEQIRTMRLPTRPTKTTDSRRKSFVGDSVEVDAILPDTLRDMVRRSIQQHIDKDALERLKIIETQERQTLENIAVNLPREFIGASRLPLVGPRTEPILRDGNFEFDSEPDEDEKFDDDGTDDADFVKAATVYIDGAGGSDDLDEDEVARRIDRYWRQLVAIYAAPKRCWAELVRRMMAEKWTVEQTKKATAEADQKA